MRQLSRGLDHRPRGGREGGRARIRTNLEELFDGLDELLAGHTQEVVVG